MIPRLPSTVAVVVAVALAACAASTTSEPDTSVSPQPQPNKREELTFSAPCAPAACGDAPSSAKRPHCRVGGGGDAGSTCAWRDDSEGTVSYSQCPTTLCGAEPTASVCPAGTTFKGNQCGSENDSACTWTTTCAPPRSTTPCPTPNGCGDAKPEIGVVCKDGSAGDLACMQVGAACGWERTCD
jgi:hypothetical protein